MNNPNMATSIWSSRRILQTSDIDAFNAIPQPQVSDLRKPFDSTIALLVIVLCTALFFLGFFSIYIRRSSAQSEPASPLRRRHPPSSKRGGLDTAAVKSLPLIPYGRSLVIDECPICLTEFHEGETVKFIPYCRHVFHPTCLDTWLASHVTCPLCRSADLFMEVRLDVLPDHPTPGIGERSTVDNEDTWRHEGVRRACSCSNLANPAVLHRSASF